MVLDAQIEWLRSEAAVGGYELAEQRAGVRDATYAEVAALIGASPDEIALVDVEVAGSSGKRGANGAELELEFRIVDAGVG